MTPQTLFSRLALSPSLPDDAPSAELRLEGVDGGVWSVASTAPPWTCAAGRHGRRVCTLDVRAAAFAELARAPNLGTVAELTRRRQIVATGPDDACSAALAFLISCFEGRDPDPVVPRLFALDLDAFHDRFPSRRVIAHDRRDHVRELFDCPELFDVHSLLDAFAKHDLPVGVHRPGMSEDGDAVPIPARAAHALADKGCNIGFDSVHQVVPGLRPLLRALIRELGMPPGTVGKCLGFFSCAGSGTVTHFDNKSNISVQVRGRKQWTITDNKHITNPDMRYVIHDAHVELLGDRPELQLTTGLPMSAPSDGTEPVTFDVGTIAYIPRGAWHSTHAIDDSLAINFSFQIVDWRQLVLQAISDRLVRHEGWRELARGFGTPGALGATAARRLTELLEGLPAEVGSLRPEDVLLSAREGDDCMLGPRPDPFVTLLERDWIRADKDRRG